MDYYNSHYKHVNKNFNLVKYKKTIFKEHSSILSQDKKILDIGCGLGFLLMALELENYKNLYGVEIDKKQFQNSKKNLKFSKLFNQDAFIFLKNCRERFDIIFLYDFLEHIKKEKIINFLKFVYKNLKKEGYLIIKTPNADSPLLSSRMRYNDFTHETAFNENSIKMILRETGFKDITCSKNSSATNLLFNIIIKPIRYLGDFILRFYMFTYIGKKAFKIILTPNFLIKAKR
jgi:cyclopropane fatty-acyl-phospholipid synthase-like methyltransferase